MSARPDGRAIDGRRTPDEGGRAASPVVERGSERRRVASEPVEAPLPIPIGWSAILFSDELVAGQVRPLRAFGVDLVAFRSASGEVGVLDAYCPHMGAHLGQGGTVSHDELVCPFHGWRWRRDGRCAAVPYSKRARLDVRTGAWPARDRNGFVYVWFDPSGDPPTWEVEEIPETRDPRYRITARKLWPDIHSHPQELNENGVDLAHFTTIHGFTTRGIHWQTDGHAYALDYDIDPLDTGIAGESKYTLESYTEGPNCTRTRFRGALEGVTVHGWLVTDPGHVAVRSLYWFKDSVSDAAARRVFENSQAGWARDVQVWHHKRYRSRPNLVPEESLVHDFRRWFAQFYRGEDRALRRDGDGGD
ncbi:MAG: Rieske 2Fe-2S domain-containing protein [Myxococcota bacterium]